MKLMTKTVKTNTTPVIISLHRDGGRRGYFLFAETTLGGKTFLVENFIGDELLYDTPTPEALMKQQEEKLLEKLSLSAFKTLS